jgi:hypothetical protein
VDGAVSPMGHYLGFAFIFAGLAFFFAFGVNGSGFIFRSARITSSSLGVLAMDIPKIIFDFDPRNLPPEILQAIGLAIACGAQTEACLDMAVGGALGIESHLTLALTAHMSLPLKISVLKSAAEFRLEVDELDELDRLLEDINQAAGRRNGYAHDGWYTHPVTKEVFREKKNSRSRLEVESIKVSVDEIKADALTIYDAGMALMTFLDDNDLFPPHPIGGLAPREHKSPAARKRRRQGSVKG